MDADLVAAPIGPGIKLRKTPVFELVARNKTRMSPPVPTQHAKAVCDRSASNPGGPWFGSPEGARLHNLVENFTLFSEPTAGLREIIGQN